MSARTELAAYLKDALPVDYDVRPYLRGLDGVAVGKTVVMVQTDRVERANTARVWTAHTSVVVVTGHQDVEQVEDALDAALDAVLVALSEYPPSIEADAERAVLGDLQGYRINLQIPYFIGEENN